LIEVHFYHVNGRYILYLNGLIHHVNGYIHHSFQQSNSSIKESHDETISCLSTLIFDRLAQASTRIQIVRNFEKSNFIFLCYFQVGCLEGIFALVNTLTPTTIRSFFHNQYDELRLLIHFFKHPFILHDLNNLQLLLDIIRVLFLSK
jgi:hypothetical protein